MKIRQIKGLCIKVYMPFGFLENKSYDRFTEF